MRTRITTSEDGSALTEFAIVVPVFVIILLWSTFIADVGLLRIKIQEVARLAAWEMTVQQNAATTGAAVNNPIRDRVVGADGRGGLVRGPQSFLVESSFPVVNVDDAVGSPIELDTNGIPSFTSARAAARAHVEASATLKFNLPHGYSLGGNGTSNGQPPPAPIRMTADSPVLLVDTWKAWPGKYAVSSGNVNTRPEETYGDISAFGGSGRDSPAEREVAARLKPFIFDGLGFYPGGVVETVLGSDLKLPVPNPLGDIRTWKDNGPIAMLAGTSEGWELWSPGYGKPVQRFGRQLSSGPGVVIPSTNERARYTAPGEAIQTGYWSGSGMGQPPYGAFGPKADDNPYRKAFKCRGAYFLGAARPLRDLSRFGGAAVRSRADWARAAYGPECQ